MLTRLARQWCADLLVLGKSGVTLGALAAWASSSPILMSVGLDVVDESTNPGYFTRQSLLTTALFGRFVVMVLAASLAARDTDWGTWGVRLTRGSRAGLRMSRLSLLLAVSVAFVLVNVTLGWGADVVSGLVQGPSVAALAQVGATVGVVVLWAFVAFAVASAARSFAVGSAGLIAAVLVEMWAESRLPEWLLAVLPQWNAGVVLMHAFPLSEIGVGPVAVHQGSLVQGVVGVIAYLLVAWIATRWLTEHQEL